MEENLAQRSDVTYPEHALGWGRRDTPRTAKRATSRGAGPDAIANPLRGGAAGSAPSNTCALLSCLHIP